jgi:hypothetical protein
MQMRLAFAPLMTDEVVRRLVVMAAATARCKMAELGWRRRLVEPVVWLEISHGLGGQLKLLLLVRLRQSFSNHFRRDANSRR